jgi:hypothetical protein
VAEKHNNAEIEARKKKLNGMKFREGNVLDRYPQLVVAFED